MPPTPQTSRYLQITPHHDHHPPPCLARFESPTSTKLTIMSQKTRLISNLRLLIPRLRLLQKKETASSVIQRRDLAQLLSEGRDSSARIRAENVIATDIAVEVMEMTELYCELLLARANVLDQLAFGEKGTRARLRAKEVYKKHTQAQAAAAGASAKAEAPAPRFGFSWLGAQKKEAGAAAVEPSLDELTDEEKAYLDTALDEAAVCIFYAWHRFPHEVRELTMLRTMLGERYGKEFMTLAQDNKMDTVKVPERLLKQLRVRPPGPELVDSYLREIAKAYGVVWPDGEEQEDLGDAPLEFVDDGKGEGDDEWEDLPETPSISKRRASDTSELNKATPPRLTTGRSPVSVAPPAPRFDNPHPRVKVPGTEDKDTGNSVKPTKAKNNGIPEVDELTLRFAGLSRKP
ncbi:hypothetical protein N7495_002349 [Penicillium taxi]|uniref:uncharacterized protein n=1 Tax=Penicillium taxi TaxID=168475 RepID=UPI002544FE5D|nr:uncharacterized protein N7495_002349 [Penicillium taxi]KAJ5901821.1 hypothetical protein N7495_002349 [Penicillium taxi]